MTGRKTCALQVPSVAHTKPLKSFLRLCMGQREVLTVHRFSVLSCLNLYRVHSLHREPMFTRTIILPKREMLWRFQPNFASTCSHFDRDVMKMLLLILFSIFLAISPSEFMSGNIIKYCYFPRDIFTFLIVAPPLPITFLWNCLKIGTSTRKLAAICTLRKKTTEIWKTHYLK